MFFVCFICLYFWFCYVLCLVSFLYVSVLISLFVVCYVNFVLFYVLFSVVVICYFLSCFMSLFCFWLFCFVFVLVCLFSVDMIYACCSIALLFFVPHRHAMALCSISVDVDGYGK